jgi:hypothetical protein
MCNYYEDDLTQNQDAGGGLHAKDQKNALSHSVKLGASHRPKSAATPAHPPINAGCPALGVPQKAANGRLRDNGRPPLSPRPGGDGKKVIAPRIEERMTLGERPPPTPIANRVKSGAPGCSGGGGEGGGGVGGGEGMKGQRQPINRALGRKATEELGEHTLLVKP